MFLFTLIFFAILIVGGVLAVGGFSFYLKRRTRRLRAENKKQFVDEPPPHRSLFEPVDEENHASERPKYE